MEGVVKCWEQFTSNTNKNKTKISYMFCFIYFSTYQISFYIIHTSVSAWVLWQRYWAISLSACARARAFASKRSCSLLSLDCKKTNHLSLSLTRKTSIKAQLLCIVKISLYSRLMWTVSSHIHPLCQIFSHH